MKRIKVILDFDGTLTDEVKQAKELAGIAKKMLAEEILEIPLEEVKSLYEKFREAILEKPHKYHWEVNGVPATYAYEGAYLLNTCTLQNVIGSRSEFIRKIKKRFPASKLDSITRCSNYLFHNGTMKVSPHFLDGAKELLVFLINHKSIEPVILTNSETRKIEKNLHLLGIGNCDGEHEFKHEIGILGDTRQYHMDEDWDEYFEHEEYGKIQVLPINRRFSVELRRPIYFEALKKVMEEGYDEIVVVADGFSLAGALPLMMGLRFVLKRTPHTPDWSEKYVDNHPNGKVVDDLDELQEYLVSLTA